MRKVAGLFYRYHLQTMEKKVNFVHSSLLESSSEEDIVDVTAEIKKFIPPLKRENHKGSCGRIGIIGGSMEYTGAPYFAGISAMKLGADLVHVFCCKDAAIPIKCYSPELMVHPILDSPDVVTTIEPWLHNLHALLIGPGLGKSSDVLHKVSQVITLCKNNKELCKPLVIDADGLHLLSENPQLLKGYEAPLILTPNFNEYTKLTEKLKLSNCDQLAAYFNAVIVKKGSEDSIHNGLLIKMLKDSGVRTLVCRVNGSYRRCGGQGDILAGFIATFLTWYEINLKSKGCTHVFKTEINDKDDKNYWKNYFKGYSYVAYAGCIMTRACNNFGFKELHRSLTTTDMINQISKVFRFCFES